MSPISVEERLKCSRALLRMVSASLGSRVRSAEQLDGGCSGSAVFHVALDEPLGRAVVKMLYDSQRGVFSDFSGFDAPAEVPGVCSAGATGEAYQALDGERAGLEALRAYVGSFGDGSTSCLVPAPIAICHQPGAGAALALQWLDLRVPPRGDRAVLAVCGAALGQLHRSSQGGVEAYGFEQDTFIGAWRQDNARRDDWLDFYIEQRLRPLFKAAVAVSSALAGPALRSLTTIAAQALRPLFVGADLRPCLLHGDLWRGNLRLAASDSAAVLLDPATFWGHSELDIATLRVLEGCNDGDTLDVQAFLDGYYMHMPRAEGCSLRVELYALCPTLRLWATFPGDAVTAAAHAARCEALATAVLKHLN